jgi:hypothetical protein
VDVGNGVGTDAGVEIGVGVGVAKEDGVGVSVGSLFCCSCPLWSPVGARSAIRVGL